MKRSDIDRVALDASDLRRATVRLASSVCARRPWRPQWEGSLFDTGTFDADAKGHFREDIIPLPVVCLCFLLFLLLCVCVFLIASAGTVGKGPVMPAGRCAVGVATQVPGSQKNKLNDPGGGGGSFRYDTLDAGSAVPGGATWGQHFTMQPPNAHTLTPAALQLRL